MKRSLRVHPAAESELHDAAIYLNERAPGVGDEFVVAVGIAMRNARRAPRIGQIVTGKRTIAEIRRMRVRPNEYQVIYVVREDHILVVAVAHTKREPLYWLDRVAAE